MEDIEAFSASYRAKLDEAENAKSIPENISLEVAANLYLFCYSFFLSLFIVFVSGRGCNPL